jgi:hypothetical protein
MALTQSTALEMIVGVQGVGAAVGQLRALGAGVGGVDVAVRRSMGSMVGLPRGIGGAFKNVFGGIAGSMGGLRGLLAPLGMALGGAGLMSMVRSAGAFQAKLTSWKLELGESAGWMASVKDRIGDAAVASGRTREELLAAAMAMNDLGMGADAAVDGLVEASNFAKLLDVSLEQAGPALAAMAKLAPDMSGNERMAMLREGAGASGMPEEQFLTLVSKLGPEIASLPGMKGQEGVSFMMRNIAARGEEFANEPKRLKTAIRGFVDGLRSQDKKVLGAFDDLGVNTTDLNQAQSRLIDAAMSGNKAFEKLPPGIRDYINETIASDGALGRLRTVYDAMSGDMTVKAAALGAALDEVAKTTTGAQLWEAIKQPFNELGDDLVAWGAEHKEELVAAVKAIIGALGELGSALATAWTWIRDTIGQNIADVADALLNGNNGDIDKSSPFYRWSDTARRDEAMAGGGGDPRLNPAGGMPLRERLALIGSGFAMDGGLFGGDGSVVGTRQQPPVVIVNVDPAVAAAATVRTQQNSTPTLPGPGGT